MKHQAYGFLFAALVMGLVGCNDDNPWMGSQGEGTLRLSLDTSVDVVDAIPVTRSTETLSAPDVSRFSVLLEKNDGSYSKEWPSLEDFAKESGFKTGSYTITAFHGDISDEGFEKPCFSGSATVTVLEARETAVAVTASLANSMVSINYTDAFKNYFPDYSASVHSEGHSYVEYARDETRPAFIAPGDIDLIVSVTDHKGRTVQVQPADFIAEARHHYHVTLDVNGGNVGEAQLVVSFDDTLVKEDVTIDLTEELFSSPAPSVSLSEGYTDGQVIEVLQNDVVENPLKFSVMARGGIASAVFTVASESYTPSFGNEIDLIKATPSQQTQLSEAGLKTLGFFNNPDKMGYVDATAFVSALPAGRHTITLVVKDKFTRVSDPVSVVFDTNAVAIEVTSAPSLYGSNRTTLSVSYNGRDLEKAFSFKAEDNFGGFADCSIVSALQRARSRAIESRTYDVTITLPPTEREVVKVKVFYYGNEVAQVEVPIVIPEYSVETDAFSNRVLLRVSGKAEELPLIVDALKVYLNGSVVPESRLSRDKNQNVIYVSGLTPSTTYSLSTTLTSTLKSPISFTTEEEAVVPNGDLSKITQTLNFTDIQIGGEYAVNALGISRDYRHKSSIVRSEADGWASLNAFTCWSGSNPRNTWFMVPSTFVEDGVATIRSVGYHHNGTVPEKSGGNFNTKYYCENAPSVLNRSIGEMFLGSYSYDGSESRSEGISFASRPKGLAFQYVYTPMDSEKGVATIAILDASGNVIGSGSSSLESSASFKTATVSISSYKFGAKAASIRIGFKSSDTENPNINVPSGTALNEGTGLSNSTKSANNYKAFAVGSELKVKDIKLNY